MRFEAEHAFGFGRTHRLCFMHVAVGAAVGSNVGACVGSNVGACVGSNVGACVGSNVGAYVGSNVGAYVRGTKPAVSIEEI